MYKCIYLSSEKSQRSWVILIVLMMTFPAVRKHVYISFAFILYQFSQMTVKATIMSFDIGYFHTTISVSRLGQSDF